jgi:hypothetical protein
MFRISSLLIVWGSLVVLQGCTSKQQSISTEGVQLPVPTKDEVARVNGYPLTVTDFLTIRAKLQNSSAEDALWVGISLIVLQTEGKVRGKEIRPQSAFNIARYALGDLSRFGAAESLRDFYPEPQNLPSPEEVKREIDSLASRSFVQRNPQSLSQFY